MLLFICYFISSHFCVNILKSGRNFNLTALKELCCSLFVGKFLLFFCFVEAQEIQYHLPSNIENLLRFGAFKHLDVRLTKSNYRERLHTLLYIEEYQRRADLQR